MPTVKGTKSRSNHSQKQARTQVEPWLSGASTSLAHLSAQAIVAIYAQRVQIEQSFRDTKNARFGLGLSNSASRTPERLAVLALIARLAEFVFRLLDPHSINHHLQYDLQLDNRKKRPEISVIRVGILLVNSALGAFSAAELRRTLQAWAAPHFTLRVWAGIRGDTSVAAPFNHHVFGVHTLVWSDTAELAGLPEHTG